MIRLILSLLTGIFIISTVQSQIISTYAGNGLNAYGSGVIPTYSGDGGLATQAQVDPLFLGKDSKGNIYISQASAYYVVRKIDHNTGIITTVAGNGTQGYSGDGGLATSAQLNEPRGIAFDSKDNLYIADYWSNCIRRVDASTGIITTIAGDGKKMNGYTGNNGPAKDALLFNPHHIAFDQSDNLYFTDFNNNCIRRIDAQTGIITKVAGGDPPGFPGFSGDGGPAQNSSIRAPWSIAVNKDGDIFFSDLWNNRIRKIAAQTGIITTIAGNGKEGSTGDGGLAINAEIYTPRDISLDAEGNLFICAGVNDLTSPYVRKIDMATGIITKVAGSGQIAFSGDGGHPLSAGMRPSSTIFDNDGNLYIADAWNVRVRKVSASPLLAPTIYHNGSDCLSLPVSFNLVAGYNITGAAWTFGDPASGSNNSSNALSPEHVFSAPGNYTITATVSSGSQTIAASTTVTIKDCPDPGNNPVGELMIPNAFSPNADGVNDYFKLITASEPQFFEMSIYNRSGQRIFHSRNIFRYWDGKFKSTDCPAEAYVYIIKYQFDGLPARLRSGNIILVR